MHDQKRLISIQEVSALLKVPKSTLRFWERGFEGVLVPLRTKGGQRRYTSIIEEIKMLKKVGLSLIEIKIKLGKGQMSEAGSQTCPQRSRQPGIADLVRDGRACEAGVGPRMPAQSGYFLKSSIYPQKRGF